MTAAMSLLLIFAITFFLVRISAVALELTGLPEHNARFQALSAITGTGFTTTESEMVINYPIRRKIIALLLVVGNLGIVSILSTLMISFVRTDANLMSVLQQIAWIIGMMVVFFGVMLTPFVDRLFCGVLSFFLEKFTFLGERHYRKLLQIGDQWSVSEHQFFGSESIDVAEIKAGLGNFSILAVRRLSGKTEPFSLDISVINPGDSLILFGHDNAHEGFKGV